jgi:hypothetical protein
MLWDDLMLSEVGDWAAERRRAELPPDLYFGPSDEQVAAAREIVHSHGWHAEVSRPAGSVQFRGADPEDLWQLGRHYLAHVDVPRSLDEQPELRTDEQPPDFVRRQAVTSIEGVPSIGPGGRMALLELRSTTYVEVSVRPRTWLAAAGGWRDPREVENAVTGMVGDARGYRLRGVFGYSEPSAYEAARSCRASYILVLDGPPQEGAPHWRVSIAVPATSGGDGDDGRGQDWDWCV